MKALRKLYTANLNNEVVAFGTNLKDFVKALEKLEPGHVRNYQYYFREFSKEKKLSLLVGEKAYILQEVFNTD